MMRQNGLGKLCEEAGEMLQITGKMIQYPELQTLRNIAHPDGTLLHLRLEQEIGDTLAAIDFVKTKLKLNDEVIMQRAIMKLQLFQKWDTEGNKVVPCPKCGAEGESFASETELACAHCGHEWTHVI